jgi:flagellar FliJ protein
MRKKALSVGDLRDNNRAISIMDGMITDQKKCVDKAEQTVEAARLKLQEVMQERKMHEKLKEKALEQYRYEENAAEFKAVDELTSYTYGQRGKEE